MLSPVAPQCRAGDLWRERPAARHSTSCSLRCSDGCGCGGGDGAKRVRREVTRGGRRKEGSRSGWPSGATGCCEAPEWPERARRMRVACPPSRRPRPRRSRPLLRRRSSAALQGAEVISSGRTHAGTAPLLPLRPRLLPSLQKAWDVQDTDREC